MLFKWKKTWPRTCGLKATPFAAELESFSEDQRQPENLFLRLCCLGSSTGENRTPVDSDNAATASVYSVNCHAIVVLHKRAADICCRAAVRLRQMEGVDTVRRLEVAGSDIDGAVGDNRL
jgi:hypothetical protein